MGTIPYKWCMVVVLMVGERWGRVLQLFQILSNNSVAAPNPVLFTPWIRALFFWIPDLFDYD
jgi:hypothetical protein